MSQPTTGNTDRCGRPAIWVAPRLGSPVMRFSVWAWVGGLPTYATRHRALGLGFTFVGLPQK
jgi:hypothetical protein